MDKLIADKFSLRPTQAILDLCIRKHSDLPPESWRQREDVLISFHIPDHYVIETTESIQSNDVNPISSSSSVSYSDRI